MSFPTLSILQRVPPATSSARRSSMPFETTRWAYSGSFQPPFSNIPLKSASGKPFGSIELTTTSAVYHHPGFTPRAYLATFSTIRASDGFARTININLPLSPSTPGTVDTPAGSISLGRSVHFLLRSCALGDGISIQTMRKLVDSSPPSTVSPAILRQSPSQNLRPYADVSTLTESIDNYACNDVLFLFPHSTLPPRQLWANSRLLRAASPYYETLFSSGFNEATTYQVSSFPKDHQYRSGASWDVGECERDREDCAGGWNGAGAVERGGGGKRGRL